jgi:membrane-associated protein
MIEIAAFVIDFIIHIDKHLIEITAQYGVWTYAILFLIIFCETGLVVTPFLPGDSLLFAAGALAAAGSLDVMILIPLLVIAGIIGDAVNYVVGRYFGQWVIKGPLGRFVKAEHIAKTESFFVKHGGKTIIFARFMPIVRTLAPFVAGIGKMPYRYFGLYNVVGAIVWVISFVLLGRFFGGLEIVQKNFKLVIAAIIVLSFMPLVIEMLPTLWNKIRQRDNSVS